jgi:hypothetical protein
LAIGGEGSAVDLQPVARARSRAPTGRLRGSARAAPSLLFNEARVGSRRTGSLGEDVPSLLGDGSASCFEQAAAATAAMPRAMQALGSVTGYLQAGSGADQTREPASPMVSMALAGFMIGS